MKRLIYNILLIAIISSLLSGCGLYKKYDRLEMWFVDSLYRRIDLPQDSISTAVTSWERMFVDPILQEWIQQGLDYNTDLNVARLKVQEAEASLLSARWAFLPGADFKLQGGLPGSLSASLNASWEADAKGKLRNSKNKALAAVEYSRAYEHSVQTQLIATIANSYYMLMMLDEQLAISKRTKDTWEENIRTLEALKRAGKTNEAAVLQAKANMLNVEASILSLEKEILSVENSFCALLSILPEKIERTTLADQEFPETLSAGVPAELLRLRPDVRLAEQSLAMAYYDTQIARSAFFPGINLSGSLGWTSGNGNISLDPGALISNLIASLVQPVFGRGVNKANLTAARARQEAAEWELRQSLLDAGVEVNNAISLWQTAKKRVELDKKQILNLQAAVWNTQLLMKHGNANYLEVLSAQKNLLSAELAEIADRYDEVQSIVNLYYALGGGYEPGVNIKPTSTK